MNNNGLAIDRAERPAVRTSPLPST